MRESVTYQAILQEGREEGREEGEMTTLINIIGHLGVKRLGIMPEAITARLKQMPTVELMTITDRVLEVESWQDIFTPAS